ncbi:MAG: Gfo/Idh/MocA family oxidoreductase [Proteobacteria bacterium]|nr:Gfo/Idh/MocA family oxidoreductase [Pseudomonadota bacterium]
MSSDKIRLGVAGLGRAFAMMIPAVRHHPRIALVAGADPRAAARARFERDFSCPTYSDVDAMCADEQVEAVYVSTPHQFHAANVLAAAARGKHVLVEKPMALALADCQAMIAAAHAAGVRLVVGHSHSFDAPIRRAREIIASGAVGPLRMITAVNYTDFLYRPRRPEELLTECGGGVLFNQAPHHVDVVRFLGGGRVRSVRALTANWDARRATEGAYCALLAFEDGAMASLTYSGYAHFDSDELCGWIAESGLPKDPERYGAARRALKDVASPQAERDLKEERNYGGARYEASSGNDATRLHQHFGLLVASCAQADLRPLPQGVMIYGDETRRLDIVPPPILPREDVLAEFCDAVRDGRKAVHDGEWALANMEVCLAMLESARSGRDVVLRHQIDIGG